MNNLAVRSMQSADVETVVAVHLAAFQGFFLTFLGPAFLRELYRAIMADPSGMAYVYEQAGQIVGFVAGTDQPAGFYRRILCQRWWCFGLALIKPILLRPSIGPRLLRAFKVSQQVKVVPGIGTLMSIAVSPAVQAKGVGKALVNAFLQEATYRKLKQVNLTTDRLNNQATNHFYQKLGFTCARFYVTPEGRAMNEYVINL
jgi:ribosomal protein S18 acetylase RimI-like enzyme